jgi:hypothetical protein
VATEVLSELRTKTIRGILDQLVLQRQRLRGSAERDAGLLEANRRGIAYWQAELSRALLAERGHGGE